MSKKRIYISLDDVAVGPMKIEEDNDLLAEIQRKYPKAKRILPSPEHSPTLVEVSTKEE